MLVKTTKLYKLITIPPYAHQRMFLPALDVGMQLFLHGSRKSSVSDNYIGTFSTVYESANTYFANSKQFDLLMEYVDPIYL